MEFIVDRYAKLVMNIMMGWPIAQSPVFLRRPADPSPVFAQDHAEGRRGPDFDYPCHCVRRQPA